MYINVNGTFRISIVVTSHKCVCISCERNYSVTYHGLEGVDRSDKAVKTTDARPRCTALAVSRVNVGNTTRTYPTSQSSATKVGQTIATCAKEPPSASRIRSSHDVLHTSGYVTHKARYVVSSIASNNAFLAIVDTKYFSEMM